MRRPVMRHHVRMRMMRIGWIEGRRVTRWVRAHIMRRRWRIATVHGISTAVWWRWSTIRVMVSGMRKGVRWKMGIPRVCIRSATVWISSSCSSCCPSAFVVFALLTG
jgi:hypothetical protein